MSSSSSDNMYNDTKASSAGHEAKNVPALSQADETRKAAFQQSVANGTAEIRTATPKAAQTSSSGETKKK